MVDRQRQWQGGDATRDRVLGTDRPIERAGPGAGLAPGLLRRKIALRLQRTAAAGTQGAVQRKKDGKDTRPAELTDAEIDAAIAWSKNVIIESEGKGQNKKEEKVELGAEAIRELQNKLGAPVTGVYDRETVKKVYAYQRSHASHGKIDDPGTAGLPIFKKLGLIMTRPIPTAAVSDKDFEAIAEKHPDGVIIAIYSAYDQGVSGRAAFADAARAFAADTGAVGLQGGTMALGKAIAIQRAGEIVEVLQSIHRGLLEKYNRSPRAKEHKDQEPPRSTRVKVLALFSHGLGYGMSLQHENHYSLHRDTHGHEPPIAPSTIEAFARGVKSAIVEDIRVLAFACSTGADPATKEDAINRSLKDHRKEIDGKKDKERKKAEKAAIDKGADSANGIEWRQPDQGRRTGEGSFADMLAKELGPKASVYGHTTGGHTVQNYAARVFGEDSREITGDEVEEGAGGVHLFDVLYGEAFIQGELRRLLPDKNPEERAALHDRLRRSMWYHYQDAFLGEKVRHVDKHKYKYGNTMGREMFVDPMAARDDLHADWLRHTSTWKKNEIPEPKHLEDVGRLKKSGKSKAEEETT